MWSCECLLRAWKSDRVCCSFGVERERGIKAAATDSPAGDNPGWTGRVTCAVSAAYLHCTGTVMQCRWRPIKLIGNNAWQGPGLSAARDTLLQSAAYNAYRDLTFVIVLWDNQLCDSHQ